MLKSKCGNCSSWRALAADTWGATYREKTYETKRNVTSIVIEHVELLNVSIILRKFFSSVFHYVFSD